MKLADAATDPLTAKAVSAVLATASGATWWTTFWAGASEAVFAVFGVPMPVVLAAALGGYGARTFLASGGLWRTLVVGGGWTAVGAFAAALAGWKLEIPADKGLAFVALVIAAGAQVAWPIVIKEAPVTARAFIEKWLGGNNADPRP